MKSGMFKPYKEVVLYDGVVCTWKISESGEKEYSRVADFIDVSKVTENVDTEDMSITLKYSDSTADSKHKEITVGLGEIATKLKILNLASKGLDINESNAKYVIKHIRNRREGLQKSYVHSNIGFFQKDKEYYFKTYKIIADNKDADIESEYIGIFLIKPKGDSKVWMNLVNEVILGRYPLELALSIGFSAAVVGFIANDIGIETLLVHFFGESTEGKSTAVMLAVSPFGNPNIKAEKGLMMQWSATTNAMHGVIGGNDGIPIAFDESGMANRKDFSKEIYSLTSGKDKIRMNKECEIREQKSWNTTIMSTGEHSIFSKSKANTGMRMRLFEFGNISWTENAEQAERIKATVLANYGHYGQVFARILIKLGKVKVIEIYKECRDRLSGQLDQSEFTDRIAGKLAVIMVAATILKQYMKIGLNLEEIEKLIIKNEAESFEDKDIAEKAYDKLIQTVAENAGKFEKCDEDKKWECSPASDRETWGRLEKRGREGNEELKLVVIADIFNKILKDCGFEEPKIILKKWKERGMLDYEANKLTRRRKIGDIDKVTCYVIIMNEKQIKNKSVKEPDINNATKEETTKTDVKQAMMTEVKNIVTPFWD